MLTGSAATAASGAGDGISAAGAEILLVISTGTILERKRKKTRFQQKPALVLYRSARRPAN